MQPRHIAIIMDGNRRWAKIHATSANNGHRKGVKTLMNLCRSFVNYNIPYLTVYAFSSENNYRLENEKRQLFAMLQTYIDDDLAELQKARIQVYFIGDFSIFDSETQRKIKQVNEYIISKPRFTFTIALNYGGRQEILHAFSQVQKSNAPITQQSIAQNLYNAFLPDVDLLIRTGGYQRLSNFLLWQITYAELYFAKCLWPDFTEEELVIALKFYEKQPRNFGA